MLLSIVLRRAVPLLACAGASAQAQLAVAPPADPRPTAAVVLTYESAFKEYRPHNDQQVGNWKEANDTVGRIGGWRAYAREAAEPSSPASVTTTPPAGATSPHSGHGKH